MKAIVVSGHHSGGRFTLLGIPGVYENGVPVPIASTGKSEAEMRALFAGVKHLKVEFVDEPEPKKKTAKQAAEPAPAAEMEG